MDLTSPAISQEGMLGSQRWTEHKDIIYELYIVQNLPLKDVRQQLKELFSFDAR